MRELHRLVLVSLLAVVTACDGERSRNEAADKGLTPGPGHHASPADQAGDTKTEPQERGSLAVHLVDQATGEALSPSKAIVMDRHGAVLKSLGEGSVSRPEEGTRLLIYLRGYEPVWRTVVKDEGIVASLGPVSASGGTRFARPPPEGESALLKVRHLFVRPDGSRHLVDSYTRDQAEKPVRVNCPEHLQTEVVSYPSARLIVWPIVVPIRPGNVENLEYELSKHVAVRGRHRGEDIQFGSVWVEEEKSFEGSLSRRDGIQWYLANRPLNYRKSGGLIEFRCARIPVHVFATSDGRLGYLLVDAKVGAGTVELYDPKPRVVAVDNLALSPRPVDGLVLPGRLDLGVVQARLSAGRLFRRRFCGGATPEFVELPAGGAWSDYTLVDGSLGIAYLKVSPEAVTGRWAPGTVHIQAPEGIVLSGEIKFIPVSGGPGSVRVTEGLGSAYTVRIGGSRPSRVRGLPLGTYEIGWELEVVSGKERDASKGWLTSPVALTPESPEWTLKLPQQ